MVVYVFIWQKKYYSQPTCLQAALKYKSTSLIWHLYTEVYRIWMQQRGGYDALSVHVCVPSVCLSVCVYFTYICMCVCACVTVWNSLRFDQQWQHWADRSTAAYTHCRCHRCQDSRGGYINTPPKHTLCVCLCERACHSTLTPSLYAGVLIVQLKGCACLRRWGRICLNGGGSVGNQESWCKKAEWLTHREAIFNTNNSTKNRNLDVWGLNFYYICTK